MICLCAHVGTWTFCKVDIQEKHGLIVIETVIEIVNPIQRLLSLFYAWSLNCFRFRFSICRALVNCRPKRTGRGKTFLAFKIVTYKHLDDNGSFAVSRHQK